MGGEIHRRRCRSKTDPRKQGIARRESQEKVDQGQTAALDPAPPKAEDLPGLTLSLSIARFPFLVVFPYAHSLLRPCRRVADRQVGHRGRLGPAPTRSRRRYFRGFA